MKAKIDYLVLAGERNNYWITENDYKYKKFEGQPEMKLNLNYQDNVIESFSQLNWIRTTIPNWDLSFKSPTHEIFLEIILSLQHLASNLIYEDALISSLPIFRIFMDNIARFYRLSEMYGSPINIDPLSFDKKKYIKFNDIKTMNEIFSVDAMKEYHFSGAESHLGSAINKNISKENTDIRTISILNIYKVVIGEFKSIFADIVVKIAKFENDRNVLNLYSRMEIIISLMFRKGIELYWRNWHG